MGEEVTLGDPDSALVGVVRVEGEHQVTRRKSHHGVSVVRGEEVDFVVASQLAALQWLLRVHVEVEQESFALLDADFRLAQNTREEHREEERHEAHFPGSSSLNERRMRFEGIAILEWN